MPPVKSVSQAADKWNRRASVAGPDYEAGIRAPRVSQAEAAAAANDSWKAGINAAVGRDAFVKGVRAAGNEKWVRGATEKGIPRYPQGVSVSQPVYQAAVSPFLDVIQRTQLPPRKPTGDPGNIERVRAMATALRNARTGTR
jgi:hypothetical protein